MPNGDCHKQPGALAGLKILDFSTLLPGPYATMMLADLGAEVLSVSAPGRRDLVKEWSPIIEGTEVSGVWSWLGRNKQSIYLNLKKPRALALVKEMIQEYDVVVEQFRPGVMKKLGIDYETLQKINPRIIYCSITGYGQDSARAGHDINYLARSGILGAAGHREEGPALYNFQIADVAAGAMNAAVGILAAAYARQTTGQGQYLDIAMADGLIPFHSMDGAAHLAGAALVKREEGLLNGGSLYDFYETRDGGFMSVGALEPKFFRALCETMGFPQWADGQALKTRKKEIKEAFRKKFLEKSRQEWTALFSEVDCCVEPVLDLDEARADERFKAHGLFPEVPLYNHQGSIAQLGNPIALSETPVKYAHSGVPTGFHSKAVLRRFGLSEAEIAEVTQA